MTPRRGINWVQDYTDGINYAVPNQNLLDRPHLLPAVLPQFAGRGIETIRCAWNYNTLRGVPWLNFVTQLQTVADHGLKVSLVFGTDESDNQRGDISDNERWIGGWSQIEGNVGHLIESYEIANEPHGTGHPHGRNYGTWANNWGKSARYYTWRLRQVTDKQIIVPGAGFKSSFEGFDPARWTFTDNLAFGMHAYAFQYLSAPDADKLDWTSAQWSAHWDRLAGALIGSGHSIHVNEFGIGRKNMPPLWKDANGDYLEPDVGDFMVRWMGYLWDWIRATPQVTQVAPHLGTPTYWWPRARKHTYSFVDHEATIFEPQFNLYYTGRLEALTLEQRVAELERIVAARCP